MSRGRARGALLDLLDERHGLGRRLVHLPVAGDQLASHLYSNPCRGRGYFSLRYVDARQLLALEELEGGPAAGRDVGHLVGQAVLLDGRDRVAAADDRDRARGRWPRPGPARSRACPSPCPGSRRRPSGRSRRPSSRPSRSPRTSRGSPRRCRRRCPSGRSRPRPPSSASRPCGRRSRRRRSRRCRPGARACRRPSPRSSPRHLDAVVLDERAADLLALGLVEREGHAPADDQLVHLGQERRDHVDLAGDLRPADDRDERPLRVVRRRRRGSRAPSS